MTRHLLDPGTSDIASGAAAQQSPEITVIASGAAAKQSPGLVHYPRDCFVAGAPRNDEAFRYESIAGGKKTGSK